MEIFSLKKIMLDTHVISLYSSVSQNRQVQWPFEKNIWRQERGKMPFTAEVVELVSVTLQRHMRENNLMEMTADECSQLLADRHILPNTVGPKPGFNFRQMLRDGRDGEIPLVQGAEQERPNARWHIYQVDDNSVA
jgi:hypothetical protein